ncbi:methyltransferase domain-containing protein [Akkermansiaceae bacterium]|nr:methyltransferase domain-containing protein [Akkermansiaceae bacterium]
MSDLYESDKLLHEYLLFHYGEADEILGWSGGPADALDFTLRTVAHFSGKEVARSLDIGCAVGRSSFEMAKSSQEVIGIDFSGAFVGAAQKIAAGESLSYQRLEEAGIETSLSASLPDGCRPERVSFEVGDATDLRADLGSFDRVHAANLVCRLPEPRHFLKRLPDLVKPGGELVLATPCTWQKKKGRPPEIGKGSAKLREREGGKKMAASH